MSIILRSTLKIHTVIENLLKLEAAQSTQTELFGGASLSFVTRTCQTQEARAKSDWLQKYKNMNTS